jgi:hypothetical protein
MVAQELLVQVVLQELVELLVQVVLQELAVAQVHQELVE